MPWIRALLAGVFGLEAVAAGRESLRFVVIDATTVQAPGATGTDYRLHVALDLLTLELRQVEVSTDKVGESLSHYALHEGDVVLVDRGYNQPKALVPFIEQGGDVVLRYNPQGMRLYTQEACWAQIDWVERLQALQGQAGALAVTLRHEDKGLEGVVHAIPLPPQKAAEARRRVRQRALKKGRQPSATSLFLSGWVLIFTSLAVSLLDTRTIAALYRLRWQVELTMKRLKSLLDIDRLRARKHSPLAQLYLYGKLLYAAVIEKLIARRFTQRAQRLDLPRTHTPWRLWQVLSKAFCRALIACFPARPEHAEAVVKSIAERPRKRTLQSLPTSVIALLEHDRQRDLSAL